jgi:hypothetical protein
MEKQGRPDATEARMTERIKHASRRGAPWITALVVVAGLGAAGISSALGLSAGSRSGPSPSDLAPIHGKYSPSIHPANFVATVDNPYWPLKPGTGFHFSGVRGKTPQTDDEIVTHRTKQILGIKCTVVRDTVSEGGRPIERTFDFYAQDKYGNVWYMGENSLELKHGHFVKASDSWQSGVNGAKPGIIMPAHPKRGDAYRQEYYPPGEALDQSRVLGRGGTVTVPYGTFKRPLVTSEFSPLEPQTEQKYYVAGLGEIQEKVVKGHHEEFKLVSVTHSG